jgi:hypothetical protein
VILILALGAAGCSDGIAPEPSPHRVVVYDPVQAAPTPLFPVTSALVLFCAYWEGPGSPLLPIQVNGRGLGFRNGECRSVRVQGPDMVVTGFSQTMELTGFRVLRDASFEDLPGVIRLEEPIGNAKAVKAYYRPTTGTNPDPRSPLPSLGVLVRPEALYTFAPAGGFCRNQVTVTAVGGYLNLTRLEVIGTGYSSQLPLSVGLGQGEVFEAAVEAPVWTEGRRSVAVYAHWTGPDGRPGQTGVGSFWCELGS